MVKSSQSGFTLIELVVVIVILGILAAFALPRFARLDTSARVASVRALEGSLRSGNALARSLWLAQGTNAANVNMEGANVVMTAGYPAPTVGGIANTLTTGTVVAAGNNTPGRWQTAIINPTTIRFHLNGAVAPAACYVEYQWNGVAAAGPTIALPPTINNPTNTSPCQ
jgi:MSHA pilin protein MshA